MAEILRGITVRVEVDTNKATYRDTIVLQEEESLQEFESRVKERLSELTEIR